MQLKQTDIEIYEGIAYISKCDVQYEFIYDFDMVQEWVSTYDSGFITNEIDPDDGMIIRFIEEDLKEDAIRLYIENHQEKWKRQNEQILV